MTSFKKCLGFLLASTIPFITFAQSLNIVGDTIYMAPDRANIIKFPEDVTSVMFDCPKENYDTKQVDNKLTVKAGVDAPMSPCGMFVEEGAGKNSRTHQFVLIFQTTPAGTTFHDYGTLDKVKERIAYLESFKPKPVAPKEDPKPAAPAPVADAPTPSGPSAADLADPNKIILGDLVVDRSEMEAKVKGKLDRLQGYMKQLVEKKFNNGDSKAVVDAAFHLFNDDTSKHVQVNNSDGVKTKPVRRYLSALVSLPYKSAEVKIGDVTFASKLNPDPDGITFRGTAYIMQEVTLKNGDRTYHSVDKKTIEIIVKIREELEKGEMKKKWEVFLGNINVVEHQ